MVKSIFSEIENECDDYVGDNSTVKVKNVTNMRQCVMV